MRVEGEADAPNGRRPRPRGREPRLRARPGEEGSPDRRGRPRAEADRPVLVPAHPGRRTTSGRARRSSPRRRVTWNPRPACLRGRATGAARPTPDSREGAARSRAPARRAGREDLRALRGAMEGAPGEGRGARAPQPRKARMRRPTALAADAPRFATRSPARQDHATRIKNAPVDLIRRRDGAAAGDGYAQPRECPASKACTGPDPGSSRKPLMAEGRSLPQVRDPSPSEVSGDGAARGLMAGPDARPDLRPDLLGGPWRRGSSFGGRGGVGAPSTEGRARRRANPNPGHTLSAGAARVGSLKHRRPSSSPAARSPAASAGRRRGAGLSTSAILHPSGISIYLLDDESHRLGERLGRRGWVQAALLALPPSRADDAARRRTA